MTQPGEEAGGSQAFSTATNNGEATASLRGFEKLQPVTAFSFIICHKSFQIVDGYRLVGEIAAAFELTRMGANPTADQGQRVSFFDHPHSF
jgi:hypothetical protein